MKDLKEFRQAVRAAQFTDNTSGILPGLVQGNVVILPKIIADQFIEFCLLNPIPCPIIGVSEPGVAEIPVLGECLDIRRDIPEYHVFEQGEFTKAVSDIEAYWQDDSVAAVFGCSFSFELALQNAGINIRNLDLGLNVSMYDTNIALKSTEHFSGNMVVSMRPFKKSQIDQVIKVTETFTKSHGAPVHIGDPAEIGIENIHQPEYGAAVPLEDDDVLVFWGCGVTTQRVLRRAKLPLLITHAPGKMLVADYDYDGLIERIQ
ncbi:MAG: putative hydro-lyase [Arenicella sp.]